MPKQPAETRDTRDILARLQAEGWQLRGGKGDHVNLFKPGMMRLITIDMGKKRMPKGIYMKVKKQAGWKE